MATHNYISLLAMVTKEAKVTETEYGKSALVLVTTWLGDRAYEATKMDIKRPSILIYTEEKEMAENLAKWKKNDIISLRGFIATRDVDKSAICPKCQTVNRRVDACKEARSGGNLVYVYPIYAEVRKHFDERNDAVDYLKSQKEITNRVFILGRLTKDPEKYTRYQEDISETVTRFPIAVNRKYCAKGFEQVLEKTDYPWIYSLGEKGERDFLALHADSVVYVDGAIVGRQYRETYVCPECGCEYYADGTAIEVLSYDTEYLSDYDVDALIDHQN